MWNKKEINIEKNKKLYNIEHIKNSFYLWILIWLVNWIFLFLILKIILW
jgi:hypothetical protein